MDSALGAWPIQALRNNFTVSEDQQAHLARCWKHQDCRGCLAAKDCSWCPFSWSCVPNSHKVPLMAPAYNEDICPHWAERWEIRTQPLGCQVSTITSLTAIVTIFSTIVGVLLIGLVGVGLVRLRRYLTRKPLRITERLRAWRARLVSRGHDREQEPLLPEQTG